MIRSDILGDKSAGCCCNPRGDTTHDKTERTHRYCREIIMSPFWLRTIIMEIMVAVRCR